MSSTSHAKIYLADQRSLNESDRYRTYHTFNFGIYNNEHRQPFGDLYLLNDDTLAGGQSLKMRVPDRSFIILIPVVGAVEYTDHAGNKNLVNAGELQLLHVEENSIIQFANPYQTELVNFIQVWVKTEYFETFRSPQLVHLNIEEHKNSLLRVLPGGKNIADDSIPHPRMSIGKFKGRSEAVYKKDQQSNSLFAFVIEGAFEVQGRLLQARDGLSYSGAEDEIELEALSNDAIIFILELRANHSGG